MIYNLKDDKTIYYIHDDASELPLETLINFLDLDRLGEFLRYSTEVRELRDKTIFYRY